MPPKQDDSAAAGAFGTPCDARIMSAPIREAAMGNRDKQRKEPKKPKQPKKPKA